MLDRAKLEKLFIGTLAGAFAGSVVGLGVAAYKTEQGKGIPKEWVAYQKQYASLVNALEKEGVKIYSHSSNVGVDSIKIKVGEKTITYAPSGSKELDFVMGNYSTPGLPWEETKAKTKSIRELVSTNSAFAKPGIVKQITQTHEAFTNARPLFDKWQNKLLERHVGRGVAAGVPIGAAASAGLIALEAIKRRRAANQSKKQRRVQFRR